MTKEFKEKLFKIIEKNGLDLNKQQEKCAVCPCVKDGKHQGCIFCEHHQKECMDSDCSTSHINREDNLALCSADDCVLTKMALQALLEVPDDK